MATISAPVESRCVIRDANGDIISRSRNLAGIRRYVATNTVKLLDISEVGNCEGQLSIYFANGSSFQTNFASFTVLSEFVARWRNVRGCRMSVNGGQVALPFHRHGN